MEIVLIAIIFLLFVVIVAMLYYYTMLVERLKEEIHELDNHVLLTEDKYLRAYEALERQVEDNAILRGQRTANNAQHFRPLFDTHGQVFDGEGFEMDLPVIGQNNPRDGDEIVIGADLTAGEETIDLQRWNNEGGMVYIPPEGGTHSGRGLDKEADEPDHRPEPIPARDTES